MTKTVEKTYSHGVKVGDIFSYSWGYEQTNVDFYVVTKVTEKTVQVREISFTIEDTLSSMSCKVIPNPDKFIGKAITKRVQTATWADQPYVYLSMTCGNARPWNGKALYSSSYA